MFQYPLTIVDEHGHAEGIHPDPPDILAEGDVRGPLLRFGGYGVTVTSGLAFRRSALEAILPLPVAATRTCPDGYLVRGIAFEGLIQRLTQPLGYYRRHSASFSNVCATPGGLGQGFKSKIGFAEREIGFTRAFAARHGLQAAADLGAADPDFIGYRLFGRLVDPEFRAPESTWQLLRLYVRARWRSPWSVKRRLVAISLAIAAAMSPPARAERLLAWLHDPDSRPRWWRKWNAARRTTAQHPRHAAAN